MQPIQTLRTVDLAVIQLRTSILDGKWEAGGLLPAERQLAAEMGINRLTLRAALARLEAEHLIVPRHGHGVRIALWKSSGDLGLLEHIDDTDAMRDLLSLRRTLAAEAVHGACIHGSPDDLLTLSEAVRRQESARHSDRFMEGDLAFTRALVAASGNLPLILLFNTIERVCRSRPKVLKRMLSDRESAIASYHALLALVCAGNAELARRAVLQVTTTKEQRALAEIFRNTGVVDTEPTGDEHDT